jgi:hypothetical protein
MGKNSMKKFLFRAPNSATNSGSDTKIKTCQVNQRGSEELNIQSCGL